MLTPALVLQAQDWIQWIESNWVMLVALLAMVGMLALFVVLALEPDSPDDDGGAPTRQDGEPRSGDSEPGSSSVR